MIRTRDRLPDAILDHPVEGVNLAPGPLRAQLGDGPTLLVFLRHFGWTFCRETVADLRRARRASPGFPEVLLVTLGDVRQTAAFLATRWPRVPAIADPRGRLRQAFGVRRGGARAFLAPGVWLAGLRAVFKGNGVGRPVGDVLGMPGMSLVAGEAVLWEQTFQHVGARPDLDAAREHAAAWREGNQPPETSTSAPASGGVSSSRSSR